MRIGGTTEGRFGRSDRRPIAPPAHAESPSRALTVVAAPAPREPTPQTRGDAAFLAHLIATNVQAPQTRARRRAEPAEALAAYRAVAGMVS
jgi:hypothetical protein